MKYHNPFDPKIWAQSHPITQANRERCSNYFGISSPGSVAACHEAHQIVADFGITLADPVPADLFVWNWGDAPDRRTTKLGGAPFWPKGRRWPRICDVDEDSHDKEPLTYVGQICFADSRDIFPDLPKDMLILLTLGEGYGSIMGFWIDLDIGPLINPSRAPKSGWEPTPLHASLYRTVDYGTIPWEELKERGLSSRTQAFNYRTSSKIGGLSPDLGAEYVQEEGETDQEYSAKCQRIDTELQSRYLASLYSVERGFIGFPDGTILSKKDSRRILQVADCGGMTFYRDGDFVDVKLSSG
jgi:hypothetical protein